MQEKKDILLQVRADMAGAVKQIAELNGKIAALRTEQAQLQLAMKEASEQGVDAQGRSVQTLTAELAANNETQKAYRKEINEVSRGVQNSIISQNTYRDTLKGMAAQLSVEKDKLRSVKIEGGILTDEYLKQQKVVNDLNSKVSLLEQAYGVYTRNVGNYKSGVQDLNEQLRKHLTILSSLPQGSKEWETTAQSVRNVTQQLEQLNREQEKGDTKQKGFFANAKVGWLAMTGWIAAVVTATAGLMRSIKGMMSVSHDFEQQQKNLQTILGLTNEKMKILTESAKELGRTTEYTASQVTELQISLAKLGFKSDDIREMSESVLALATDLDAGLGESADLVGSILRQFGRDASDTANVVDVLVKGANESALSFSKYVTAMAQVAPVANAMGFDLEGVVAILGSLVNVGMDASMAATSTRNILLKLADANSDLAKSLSKPVRDIPTLVAGLKELQGRGLDVAGALELTDKRSVAAFSALLRDADAIEILNGKLADLDGYAIGIREERLQTTEGAIKMLKSAWEGFTLAVMQSEGTLARVYNGLANAINGITDRINPEGVIQRELNELIKNYSSHYDEIIKVAKAEKKDIAEALEAAYEYDISLMQSEADNQERIAQRAAEDMEKATSRAERKRLQQIRDNALAEIEQIKKNYKALKEAYATIDASKAASGDDTSGTAGGGSAMTDEDKKKESQSQIKRLESARKLADAMLAQQRQYEYDSTKSAAENAELKWQHEQEWQARNKEAQDSFEREKLRIQYQYDQISREEYENGLKTLEVQRDTFYAEQEQKALDHYTKVTDNIVRAMTGGDIEGQIADVKRKYEELYAGIDAMVVAHKMTEEEATYYRISLKNKEANEIKKIQAQETDNERKALEDEAKARAEKLNTDLKLAWDNAEEQYRIRKEFLLRELELYKDNKEQRAELEEELAALESTHQLNKIERLTEYTNQVIDMMSSVSTIASNISQQRISEAEDQNEKEKSALDKRLKAGLISQRQYDDKVEKMDAELAEQKAEETRKQAAREKALSAFQIILNTAAAIMRIWAEVPKMDFGASTVALTAVAATMGALQLGAVMSEPLPKARRGGSVKGATHEQGGVLIETENNERIIAAQPSKAFPELLNLISYIGKNGYIPQTGYAEREYARTLNNTTNTSQHVDIDYDVLADVLGERIGAEMQKVNLYLSLTELRDAQQDVARLDELTKQ